MPVAAQTPQFNHSPPVRLAAVTSNGKSRLTGDSQPTVIGGQVTTPETTVPTPPLPPVIGGLDEGKAQLTDHGYALPAIRGYRWERKADCFELWQSRNGKRVSGGYIARAGKRLLAQWQALPETERQATIREWVAERCAGKGIT